MKLHNKMERIMDKRIERAYYATCSGLQINVLDMGKVFAFGRQTIERNPEVSDTILGATIRAYVERLAK